MKRIISFLFAIVTATLLSAQSIEFVSIEQVANDLDAQKYPIYYGEEKKVCALVKVQLPIQDVVFENDFIIGEPQYKVNEYWIYMADGAAKLDVKHPIYSKLTVSFGMKLESKMTYSLILKANGFNHVYVPTERSVEKDVDAEEEVTKLKVEEKHDLEPNDKSAEEIYNYIVIKNQKEKAHNVRRGFSIYLGPQFQPLGFTGVGGLMGIYIKRFNMQVDYISGLTKSEKIYWNKITENSVLSNSYGYTPSYIGASIGCAVTDSRSFRCTPQIGFGAVLLNGKEVRKGTNTLKATNGYATSVLVGARMEIRFSRSFGTFLAPQYRFAVFKSDLFDRVSKVSKTVKNYADNFCGNVGFYLEF